MRISDWSSDVCSSDLLAILFRQRPRPDVGQPAPGIAAGRVVPQRLAVVRVGLVETAGEIGRASCRERVGQYVSISVVAVSLQKKTIYITVTIMLYHYTANTIQRSG